MIDFYVGLYSSSLIDKKIVDSIKKNNNKITISSNEFGDGGGEGRVHSITSPSDLSKDYCVKIFSPKAIKDLQSFSDIFDKKHVNKLDNKKNKISYMVNIRLKNYQTLVQKFVGLLHYYWI